MFIQNPCRYNTPSGWRDIKDAPKDGTVIEIQNNWGVAPWFMLSRWEAGKWRAANNSNSAMADEGPHLSWRPYDGQVGQYCDPTGGAQYTMSYWQRACGRPDLATIPEDQLRFDPAHTIHEHHRSIEEEQSGSDFWQKITTGSALIFIISLIIWIAYQAEMHQ